MNYLLTVTLLIFSLVLNANEQFAKLAQDIGDKRIVFLDELTHGEREVFKLKADISEYLHQHHGFDALVLESGMYDMEKLWHGGQSLVKNASGNVFYMYANEPVFQDFLGYIEQNKNRNTPLELAGFDGRLSGELSKQKFTEELKQQLQVWLPNHRVLLDWKNYSSFLNNTIQRQLKAYSTQEQTQFHTTTVDLINSLQAYSSTEIGYQSPDYYALLLDGLLIVANNQWGKRRFDEHDIAMANNLDWLLRTELKDKKVIVWGQFVHLNKRYYTTSHTDNVTSIINKRYPQQTYVLHFAGLKGSYRNFITGQVESIVINKNSAETYLRKSFVGADKGNYFVSKSQHKKVTKKGLSFYGLQYKTVIPAEYGQLYWDGMFLLEQVSPSK